MSNFICPTCGLTNIDCGKAGYKTDREIELEKDIERLSDRNAKLEKRLYIAVQALEEMSNETLVTSGGGCYANTAYDRAQKALAKISEVKK